MARINPNERKPQPRIAIYRRDRDGTKVLYTHTTAFSNLEQALDWFKRKCFAPKHLKNNFIAEFAN